MNIDSSKLEEEFSLKKITAPVNNSSEKSPVKIQAISTLSSQRQQNINLVLSKAKLSGPILVEALKKYDLKRLTNNMCELLIPILPNESEISGVKSYEDPSQLADSDKFVFALADVCGFDLRMKTIIFYNTYKDSFSDLEAKLSRVNKILEFFNKDDRVFEWLKIILAYGNYLNGTSNRSL